MIYVEVIGPNGSEKTSVESRIIVLNFGQKHAEGGPEEVMAKPEVKEAYLGSEGERC